ncbi:regulator [Streptomyces sp. Tu 6176]|uniref:ATP-binding protein n=1 Tax=Streptomyces sp. Tu 6176 TaxID=1470557 RepID=UPI0004537537|nr:tetratricopeptide repeat protein [Streptomyces sp. Tu 6176]EYT81938.1 regulator [Streptomyces sp. Tu 6176]
MDENTFGGLLREARQRALLTLESLAEASGVSVRAISDMERGRSLPRQATLGELLDALRLEEGERRRLVRAATRHSRRVPRQLPPDLAVFRGREQALAAVRGFTSHMAGRGGHVVISAIGGMAGVGKTTLAVHWAHEAAERFPDGQLYVNLRGFDADGQPLDPGEALGGFLRALDVPGEDIPSGAERRSALFRERAAALRLIVVLDNARDADQVRPLLPGSAGCLTIITSRDRLPGLAAAEGASLVSLDVWSREEAVTALAARIGEERCAAEPAAAAELVELCGCLPLAVAVVGAQLSTVPGMPLRVGVRELRETRPRLDALSVDDGRVDVRAVFSWSYRALGAGTARFFRYLCVHPGPAVSAEAAASLAGVGEAQGLRCLRELTAASLLTRDTDGCYVLHDLVRDYGTELFAQEKDDRLGAETRLLDYLRHNAHGANRFVWRFPSRPAGTPVPGVARVETGDREEALEWYRREESTADAALRAFHDPRLLRHRLDLTLEWVAYNSVTGRWAEEIAACRTALDAALTLDDPVGVARTGANLSRALVEQGDLDAAGELLGVILGQLPRLPLDEQLQAERHASRIRHYEQRYDEGLRHARNSLALARSLGQPYEVARALAIVAYFLCVSGDPKEAVATCEEVLPLLRETGNRHDEAATWRHMGHARQRAGDLTAAIAHYGTALGIYQEVLDDYNVADVLDHLATAELEQGNVAGARANWYRAAELFTALRAVRADETRAKAEAAAEGPASPPGE